MISRPKKPRGPGVHLRRDRLGDAQERLVAAEGDLEVAQVVERHRVDLAERILAVEHPAVGPGEQGVGHVADARLHRRARPGGGSGPLDPLPLQVVGDLRTLELPLARLLHGQRRARDDGGGVEEADPPAVPEAGGPPLHPRLHEIAAVPVEARQGLEGLEALRGQHVRVKPRQAVANPQPAGISPFRIFGAHDPSRLERPDGVRTRRVIPGRETACGSG